MRYFANVANCWSLSLADFSEEYCPCMRLSVSDSSVVGMVSGRRGRWCGRWEPQRALSDNDEGIRFARMSLTGKDLLGDEVDTAEGSSTREPPY